MPRKVRYKKEKIPKALREQVWISRMGKIYEGKCTVSWCSNVINVYDFQCGHNIPESRGGKTDLANLIPVCSRCNMSMSNKFTIDEWNRKSAPLVEEVKCCSCFY
jgi:5-methylcytosine-specific restriction endonuclease McrA